MKINEGVARCKVYPSLWVALYSWHPDNSSYILLYCVYNSLVWVYKLFSSLAAYLTEEKFHTTVMHLYRGEYGYIAVALVNSLLFYPMP